jgi:hypothetical protein
MAGVSAEYAAGFFDGEGSIRMRHQQFKGRMRWILAVDIGQNDRRPLDALAARWGGQVRERKEYRSRNGVHYSWRVTTAQAHVFLCDIRPFLIVKAEAVDIVLEMRSTIHLYTGRRALPSEEIARRDQLGARLRIIASRRGRAVGETEERVG